ncbi:elongation factor Ts [Candidatus Kaiserbacteria bacterium CG10_big_fil_rev_8_21_14_0_10_49_17]|uniref:Elongation factor Ts n=1 Tax=Candidatus Kaiserbacteria bacterium CG10_big_fil_rev_8_21_14_0_10_49_17 TaxID=1974609 RepID=A0A2M6WF06_9BACT|nr:MAG: elongation factor Ts [Candidatus Kaiserbacteria bacterium CG10_big_fil_rev_8_21_14_0_10_49_17]
MAQLDQVKELRDQTGVSIMQCKKALEEAGGDTEKALVLLRKSSSAIAAKKADRELGAGVVESYIHANKQVGTIVVLSCETDFVAKNEEFVALARDIAMHITASAPQFKHRNEVTDADTRAAEEVFRKEIAGKPADMQEKILQGKLDSFLSDKVLLEQAFIKDESRTIGGLIEEATQKFGERIEISSYCRYAI